MAKTNTITARKMWHTTLKPLNHPYKRPSPSLNRIRPAWQQGQEGAVGLCWAHRQAVVRNKATMIPINWRTSSALKRDYLSTVWFSHSFEKSCWCDMTRLRRARSIFCNVVGFTMPEEPELTINSSSSSLVKSVKQFKSASLLEM